MKGVRVREEEEEFMESLFEFPCKSIICAG
jgi:hypothetical protein